EPLPPSCSQAPSACCPWHDGLQSRSPVEDPGDEPELVAPVLQVGSQVRLYRPTRGTGSSGHPQRGRK
ncbi:hypothetical protein KDM92_18300, partial [Undibacterium sp. BYS107W]|nr:hypothetical protein [Undibacterium baiyunense]